jgi:hypothetical protein
MTLNSQVILLGIGNLARGGACVGPILSKIAPIRVVVVVRLTRGREAVNTTACGLNQTRKGGKWRRGVLAKPSSSEMNPSSCYHTTRTSRGRMHDMISL